MGYNNRFIVAAHLIVPLWRMCAKFSVDLAQLCPSKNGMVNATFKNMKTCLVALVLWAMNLQADILKELECHDKVVREGIESLIMPKEVESLFGTTNVDHFISNFGSKATTPVWNSTAYFSGRYVLTLQIPILIDDEKCRLLGATNSAVVQINEVVKVELSTSGIAGATMKGQWRLNENQWKWLVKNKGDWSVVKIPILTNAPVKGFAEFERQVRAPIRDRKKGFDAPVKKALEQFHKK
jgi:hypothetical protein